MSSREITVQGLKLSNMFRNVCAFFTVPQALVRSGLLAKMRPVEVAVYIALLHEFERRSTTSMKITNAHLKKLAGVSARALHEARPWLKQRGLINNQRTAGGAFIYALLHPVTGEPLPDPKQRFQPPRTVNSSKTEPATQGGDRHGDADTLDKYGLPGIF